jgi:hypothetical protein
MELIWEQEAAGSNPAIPTGNYQAKRRHSANISTHRVTSSRIRTEPKARSVSRDVSVDDAMPQRMDRGGLPQRSVSSRARSTR